MKIYLIPRYGGNATSDWYNWIDNRLHQQLGITLTRLNMPNWQAPDKEEALAHLEANIQQLDEETYFIAHSIGCLAVLNLINKKLEQGEPLKLGGFLFVAAWFKVDKIWDTLLPWLDNDDLNYPALQQAFARRKVVISDNDQFHNDYRNNEALWQSRMAADVQVIPDRAHFNYPEQPGLETALFELLES